MTPAAPTPLDLLSGFAAGGEAELDLDRLRRRGLPEAVLCSGKSDEQILAIARRFAETDQLVLLTRLGPDRAVPLLAALAPAFEYDPIARLAWRAARPAASTAPPPLGPIAVVTGGTSDVPVAAEAARCAELWGNEVHRYFDVGVAGLHRLLSKIEAIRRARCIIAVAGMEAALPSVLAGLVAAPVIGVPTSVGYGASFGGVAALLGMLNACSGGISVVNIDNGFGAAMMAHLICQPSPPPPPLEPPPA